MSLYKVTAQGYFDRNDHELDLEEVEYIVVADSDQNAIDTFEEGQRQIDRYFIVKNYEVELLTERDIMLLGEDY